MGKRLVLLLSFVSVFALGFVTGTLWRSAVVAPSVSTTETAAIPSSDVIDLAEAETRIAKALEDPDFKRIHDYLNRERPMQLQIPASHEEPPQDKIPMTERPPVKFTLE